MAFCLLAMIACNDGAKLQQKDNALAQQRDSMNQIIAQKDNEINDMMGTLNDIEEGFREISEAQGRVAVAKRGEGASSAQRIRENMEFIQNTMKQNRELIKKLQLQLRESTINGEQLKRAIENLTAQLEQKDKELSQLRAELEAKDIHIAELDETISGLSQDVASLKEETSQKSETITAQDSQLHTAWFVFGTKKELKEQNILKSGEVLRGNFNKEYFTKIDIRVDKEIKLYSRDAKIMTDHPSGTYTLTTDANKQYVLRITNPDQFWSTSKYLVVLVK
jgi:chromosome segregation ATPase